ncbi:MAG: hypothetical protein LC808_37840 [Actinobacteria bacterium]|nr:hypothetical protein [Actinomycetota bacterium]
MDLLPSQSKLLSFPRMPVQPKDEGERDAVRRLRLNRRGLKLPAVRAYTTKFLAGDGQHVAVVMAGCTPLEPSPPPALVGAASATS